MCRLTVAFEVPTSPARFTKVWGSLEWYNVSEPKVLHYGPFAKNLVLVMFHHACVYSAPGGILLQVDFREKRRRYSQVSRFHGRYILYHHNVQIVLMLGELFWEEYICWL